MRGLRISDALALPPETTVTSTLVAYGGKGMGKTNLGAVLVEELTAAGLRWAWLDPLGVSWGLRHSADGKGPGVECLVLGGTHGDIPILPEGGAAVADIVVEESVNVLIDFSRKPNGEMWSVGEKIRFVTAYAHRLFQRQGEQVNGRRREPLFQVLDEAARYIPQQIRAGDQDIAKCVGAWEQLVEEGRNVSIGVGLFTQRSARMSKSVSELADVIFAFRTVGPNSLAAILDWLGEHVEKERIKSLGERVRSLDRGDALVVSPGWLKFEGVVRIRLRKTFDSSATVGAGGGRIARGEGARPDLAKIRERMNATIERAKADDPKELRKQIAELKAQLAKKVPASKPQVETQRIEVPVVRPAEAKRLAIAVHRADKLGEKLREAIAVLHGVSAEIGPALKRAGQQPQPDARTYVVGRDGVHVEIDKFLKAPVPITLPQAPRAIHDHGNGKENGLPGPQRAILTAIAQRGRVSTRVQVAILSGYSIKSSSFANALGALRSAGLVGGRGDALHITHDGLEAVGPFDAPPEGPALLQWWSAKLGKPDRLMLEAIVQQPGIGKEELSTRTGYSLTSSSFANALGKLRSLGLVDGRDQIEPAPEFLA